MSLWKIDQVSKKPKLNNPVFIEGMPGIGNVGKVAIDFMIDELKAVKLYDVFSYTLPHSVFVREDNLVELPKIEIYYKKFNGKRRDIILLSGDVQPMDEVASYEFSESMLDVAQDFKCREIITMGGIGLSDIPKNPKLFCTGNTKKIIKRYRDKEVDEKIFGVVGPIVGVSGLLVGLASKRKINAIALLAETYGHPMYLGIKGAREMLKLLNKKLELKLDLNRLDREIKDIEGEVMKKTKQLSEVAKQSALRKLKTRIGEEVDYIG